MSLQYNHKRCILVLCVTGDPIACINDGAVPGHVINTYCWITHTFTLPYQIHKPVGTHVAHPGVGGFVEGENEQRYHSYYQWVPFMLFFQVSICQESEKLIVGIHLNTS